MSKKIMLVDDAAFMRMMIKNTLKQNGYTDIIEAKDGEEAIELFKQENPDLTLLDITMPNIGGLEALREIKNINKECKVIMCSACLLYTSPQKYHLPEPSCHRKDQ